MRAECCVGLGVLRGRRGVERVVWGLGVLCEFQMTSVSVEEEMNAIMSVACEG